MNGVDIPPFTTEKLLDNTRTLFPAVIKSRLPFGFVIDGVLIPAVVDNEPVTCTLSLRIIPAPLLLTCSGA